MDEERPFTPDLPPGYAIDRARPDDAPGIAAVYEAAYPSDTDYPLVEESAVHEALLGDSNVATFVVATGGTVVGTAAIEYDSLDDGNAQICKLAVHPDHQGRGLGRELLKHRLNVLHADRSFSGVVYSAAVTSHPASQHNLLARGFEPFSIHKGLQEGYFGPTSESEVITLYTPSIDYDERDVYVPERYRHIVERTLASASLDLLGRRIRTVNTVTYPTADQVEMALSRARGFLWEVTADGHESWARTEAEIRAAMREEDVHLMVPVDANARHLLALYEPLEADGFSPAGFIPDWLTRDGEDRDAFVFQHPPSDEPAAVCVVDDVKALIDVLGWEYRVVEDADRYWTLEL
ncbi:GNAT family N-acetyltransferase [Haloplanus pelagicus]|jgi:ribosomal protein S18 acetylase RimI-like enzyme|uniref:GNAT family N-acetyltransferase n=1 Tax=Haloplanus pelagicus TaxID=2949995 RepID=UPI00203AB91F|nr:GNAT family N-acetyltransferase [Haloplanus sp. HW8-1]